MIKASNSFIAAKGSMPLPYKIVEPTGTKHKADNQDELYAIKKLKTLHISSGDAIKQKKTNKKKQTNKQTKNKNSQDLMKMIHHLALNGMKIIIIVPMMLYLQFCSTYGQQTQKKWEKIIIPRLRSISFYTT
jgi:hypothetical protein